MNCPMCGEPDVIDGYCSEDHREIDIGLSKIRMLRAPLLEIAHLGENGAWYTEMARAGYLRAAEQ